MSPNRPATAALSLALALGALGWARPARACASCGCGDMTLTATGVERPYQNRVRAAVEERYGSLTLGDASYGQHIDFLRSTLAASWSPVDRLTLSALLPWVTSWVAPVGQPRETVNGLGDLELAARVVVFRERHFAPHHLLWLMAGLKFPTG
ncbi:MAG: transporter, partial [Polyangia bacterium]